MSYLTYNQQMLHPFLRVTILMAMSVALLILSFEPFNYYWCVYGSLIPLLFLSKELQRQYRFWVGWLVGVFFFGSMLYWIMYVTWPGAVLLVMYLSVYLGLFSLIASRTHSLTVFRQACVLASSFTLLEFIRAHALSGFSWASLAHSQAYNTAVLQVASVAGADGINFLIVAVNVLLFRSFVSVQNHQYRNFLITFSVAAGLVGIVWYGGRVRIESFSPDEIIRAGIVQPNVLQNDKWKPELKEYHFHLLQTLSESLVSERPDFLVWPETAFPAIVQDEPLWVNEINQFTAMNNLPLIYGAITMTEDSYFNSAILNVPHPGKSSQYNKHHLVPFGEFIPLRPILGWINAFVPMEDFSSGQDLSPLRVPLRSGRMINAASLICFEDTVSDLAIQMVREGAELFINLTNDAWFLNSKQPLLHFQTAIFRTVETGRSLVRATNTGVSGVIDPLGRVIQTLEDPGGKRVYIQQAKVLDVPIARGRTWYVKLGGFFFPAICLLSIMGCVFVHVFKLKRN